MRSKFAVILHASVCTRVCWYVCTVSTYVPDSRRQLDNIDAVRRIPAAASMHTCECIPRIKGGIGCSFVFPRYKSGLPEQSMLRYRSELDIGRDPDGHYRLSFSQVAKRLFCQKRMAMSMRECTFHSAGPSNYSTAVSPRKFWASMKKNGNSLVFAVKHCNFRKNVAAYNCLTV